MNPQELERKLKRERVQVCINCKNFVHCNHIGMYEECIDFKENKDEVWIIRRI